MSCFAPTLLALTLALTPTAPEFLVCTEHQPADRCLNTVVIRGKRPARPVNAAQAPAKSTPPVRTRG